MIIPKINHKRIKYRNGENGLLLTNQRDSMVIPVMTLTDKDSILYHNLEGKYLNLKEEHPFDVLEIVDQ